MKVLGNGRAKILTPEEIDRLFDRGFTAVPAVMRYTKVIAKILFLNENLFNRSTRKNSGSTSSGKHIH